MLDKLGISYEIDTNMVRGLDYYNHTIFEFMTEVGGSDLTICAGGRYDGLVSYFGGPETPAFGFGMGIERLILVLEKQSIELPIDTQIDVYIAVLGQEANGGALELVQAIRKQGFRAERDHLDRKLKAQFKSADVFGAKTIITLGGSEIESGQVVVKNNQTRKEVETSLEIVKTEFASILEKLSEN
jgi:histidyl-tRNA synthetase